MLKTFSKPICDLAFVYAHSGTRTDDENRVYEISAAILKNKSAKKESFAKLTDS
jgi:ATP-dependent DNA helicase DinG